MTRTAQFLLYGLLTFLITVGPQQGSPFLSDRKSPLKEDAAQTQVHIVQERFRRIYDLYRYSVVFIKTDLLEKNENRSVPTGPGSGFILSEEGFLCTNAHVVMGASSVDVIIDRKSYPAKVIGVDVMTDLALLKVDPSVPLMEKKFVPIYAGDSGSVRVVEELRLYGKVRRGFLGVQIEEDGTLVTGVIDASPAAVVGIRTGDRIVRVDGKTVKNYRELIRIVGPKPAGSRIAIELLRHGKPLKLSVTLGERP